MYIRQKLGLAFPAAVATGIAAFGIVSFVISIDALDTALRTSANKRLESIRHARTSDVVRYFDTVRRQARALSENIAVIEATRDLKAAFHKEGLSPSARPSPGLFAMHARIHRTMRAFVQEFDFSDVYIVDPDAGHVLYSVSKKVDSATSLTEGPYATSGLGQAFRQANRLTNGEVALTDFEPHLPSHNGPAAFLATPIFDRHTRLGILIFHIPIDRIDKTLIANGPGAAIGLGQTGESVLVGKDHRLRSNRRGLIENRAAFLQARRSNGVDTHLAARIEAMDTTIGIEVLQNEATERALAGESGTVSLTERGKEKLTSFAPISILGHQWAIITEIDKDEALAELTVLRSTVANWFAGTAVVLLLFAATVGWLLARSLVKPIHGLRTVLNQLSASNDFSLRVDVTARDEVGDMAEAINSVLGDVEDAVVQLTTVTDAVGRGDLTAKMQGDFKGDLAKISTGLDDALDSLSSAMSTAHAVSCEVGGMANELTKASTELATGAHDQSAAAHQSLAAMEQTSSMASINADHANEATGLATSAALAADGGQQQMGGLSEAMRRIESSSKSIVKVTKVIEEIAFQTNLLAINAAVEAARAGRHGRGFAVVAQEVQNLAARSATAAKETETLVQEAGEAVEDGVTSAEATSVALEQIVQNVRCVESLMTEIAQASAQQATGVNQVREAMSHVNRCAEKALTQSGSLQSSASSLLAGTSRLENEVGRFALRGQAVSPSLHSVEGLAQATTRPRPASAHPGSNHEPLPDNESLHHDERGYGSF